MYVNGASITVLTQALEQVIRAVHKGSIIGMIIVENIHHGQTVTLFPVQLAAWKSHVVNPNGIGARNADIEAVLV